MIDYSEILVSVIIATYKRDKSLVSALQSLTTQTYKNFEVVVVDDSADINWNIKVKEILDNFTNLLSINYVINKDNMGSASSRNIGIENSKGKYITFLDDDDQYLPQKIEMQLKDMVSANADYGITDLYLYNEKDELIDKRVRSYILVYDTNELMRYHLMYHMTGTDTLMFKTDYLKKIGGFPGIDVGDEFYLIKEAILAEGKFVYSPHCYVKAYVHNGEVGGLSSGDSKINGENLLFEEKKKYFNYLSVNDIRYVRMRHYAVIAFAEIRRKKVLSFIIYACKSFFTDPKACVHMLLRHK